MEVDRRLFLATLGVGALELMSPEDKAEALEHYMEEKLDAKIAARDGALLKLSNLVIRSHMVNFRGFF